MSFESGWTQDYWSAVRILTERLTDELRHTSGMSYEVDWSALAVDQDLCHLAIWADARPGREREVAERLWTGFRSLAEDGPTAEELEHQLAGLREYSADPRSAAEEAGAAARAYLLGRTPPTLDELATGLSALGPRDVVTALGAARDSTLLVAPEATRLDLADLPLGPECTAREVAGTVFRRRFRSEAPRGSTLVVGDDGVTLVDGEGRHTVRWTSCVGVGIGDDARLLLGAEGCVVPVVGRDWRDGSHAIEAVDRQAPPHVRFRLPAEATS